MLSVSNLGMFGVSEFTAVINPPQAGILAVGGLEESFMGKEKMFVPGSQSISLFYGLNLELK